jgi:signal transduction histidine kinase
VLLLSAATVAALLAMTALALGQPNPDLVQVGSTVLLTVPALAVGLVVGLRRPDNAVGPLLSLQAAVFAFMLGLQDAYDETVLQRPGSLPATAATFALERASWMALYVPVALILLTFPTGRFLSRRWTWVAAALVVVAVLFTLIAAMSPAPLPGQFADQHPFGTAALWLRAIGWALLPVFMALLVASAGSMVLRYRRSADPVERAQLRWLALGAWTLPATLLLCWLSLLFFGRPDLGLVGLAFAVVAIPATTVVAMLRHDLYDVDRALSAVATYAVISACLLAVVTATEMVAGVALGQGSAVVAALATAISIPALAPVRRRAQRAIDRRLYPMRAALHQGIAELRAAIDAGTAEPEDIEPTLRKALRGPGLRIGFLPPGEDTALDNRGQPVTNGVPIELAGATVGRLEAGETPASNILLREAAKASALFVELGRLRTGMAQAMAEIQSSRGRLLRHGYEERRKLQRDLHDGAQQRLVALGMSLRLAQRHLTDNDGEVHALLDQAVTQLGTAVAELRAIAAGLRPPGLDAGLAAAVRSLVAGAPLPVDVSVADDPVPDDIATTAYYVVSEGLTNAIKHANASRVHIALRRSPDGLSVEVSDDGIGGAHPAGSGLAGLADRVAAAGGQLRIDTAHEAGTLVKAVLPCGS